MVTCLIEDTCPMTSHLPKNVHQDVPDQFIKVSNNIIEFASFYDQKTFFVQFWTTPLEFLVEKMPPQTCYLSLLSSIA